MVMALVDLRDAGVLKTLELRFDGQNYFGVKDGTVYKLGRITADFLQVFQTHSYEDSLAHTIREHQLSKEESEILASSLERLVEKVRNPKVHNNYLKLSFTLIPAKWVVRITKPLSFLFNKWLFAFLFILGTTITISYFWLDHLSARQIQSLSYSYYNFLIIFAGVFVIAMLHELGHSVATIFYDIRPKEIGFGFYIFFPVLYSNVTEIWILNKTKRIHVNSAGIYFQLLTSIALVFFSWTTTNPNVASILNYLIVLNVFMMVYSLVPFIRNDGYWIIGDLLEIEDLNKQSNGVLFHILKKRNIKDLNKWLLFYSLCSYIFILFLAWTAIKQLADSIKYFISLESIDQLITSFNENWLFYIYFLISVFFIFLLVGSFISWIRTGIQEFKKV